MHIHTQHEPTVYVRTARNFPVRRIFLLVELCSSRGCLSGLWLACFSPGGTCHNRSSGWAVCGEDLQCLQLRVWLPLLLLLLLLRADTAGAGAGAADVLCPRTNTTREQLLTASCVFSCVGVLAVLRQAVSRVPLLLQHCMYPSDQQSSQQHGQRTNPGLCPLLIQTISGPPSRSISRVPACVETLLAPAGPSAARPWSPGHRSSAGGPGLAGLSIEGET